MGAIVSLPISLRKTRCSATSSDVQAQKTPQLRGVSVFPATLGDVQKRSVGAGEGNRTPDPRITNALLYQLSYSGARGAEYRHSALRGQPPEGFPALGALRRMYQVDAEPAARGA